ncbi:hypothetical protein [Rhizobium sp. SG570]|uniref:hypothetical protein n=1 Tax=Rhizobium sp. SG570 TaxID=2587113 RepID=UPI0017AAEF08|nr:hypothetical protein [Rhizobium sp. SG570]NKJ39374.1 hypothetical protein [Rhizobium sp. SG570]
MRSPIFRKFGFGAGQVLTVSGQPIAETELGPNHATIRTKRPPNGRHLGLEVVLFYDNARPNGVDELIFRNEFTARLDENPENIERARADVDLKSVAQDQAQARKDAIATEIDAFVVARQVVRGG